MSNVTVILARSLDYAFSAYRAGDLVEVEDRCIKILQASPDTFDALHLLAVVQSSIGKKNEALLSYDRAVALRPHHAQALSNRGATLHDLLMYEDALASFDRALGVQPEHAEALSNRGNTLREMKRLDEALASYDRALAIRPNYAEALSNRGVVLYELRRFEEALASYDAALAVRPDYPEVHYNRGNTLRELKRLEEALTSYDLAVAARPDHAQLLCNRGHTLHELKHFEEALASYDHAIAVRPHDADALFNRANTLGQLRRIEEALESYDRALAMRPNLASAEFNEALCRLLTGDLDRGLAQYEARWKTPQRRKDKRDFAQPLWLGSNDIEGKTIFLQSEQGFGDTIQFCRYVPLVAERGARVVLGVPKALQELMRSLPGNALIESKADQLPAFDLHCPLLSLPLAFGTRIETIPAAVPYLCAPAQSVDDWSSRLRNTRRPRVGVAWSGRPTHRNDRNRSMPLSTLLPILDVDATFVSLQKVVRSGDAAVLEGRGDLLHYGDELKDFGDTAALIANLDLVISVDTAVAHLAGALGKPVWLMLPYIPDWRWLLDRDDSPWYPTFRLYRQDESRAWESVIARVSSDLQRAVRDENWASRDDD